MRIDRKTHFSIYVCVFYVALLLMSSCSGVKEVAKETVIESISDPKTGTPVFTRAYDTRPYQINIVEIVSSRKKHKKRKKQELIDVY